MEQRYLIDTNLIIDNFGNKLLDNAKSLLYSIDLTISAVTKIEVLGWLNATKEQLQPLYEFMEIANVLPINEAVIEKTIAIRQTKKIALGDAIIAATALVYDLVIISRNTSDFKNIDGLQVIDPYKIWVMASQRKKVLQQPRCTKPAYWQVGILALREIIKKSLI